MARKPKDRKPLSKSALARTVSQAHTWAIVDVLNGYVPMTTAARRHARDYAKWYTKDSGNLHVVRRANLRLLGERA